MAESDSAKELESELDNNIGHSGSSFGFALKGALAAARDQLGYKVTYKQVPSDLPGKMDTMVTLTPAGTESADNEDVVTVEARAGQRIQDFARDIVMAATRSGLGAKGKFNDIELSVPAGTDNNEAIAIKLVEQYKRKMDDAREAYRTSPEGVAAAARDAEDIRQKQATIDGLMRDLDTLDFTDVEAVLKWCVDFQDPSDRIGTQRDSARILQVFADNGYVPGMNVGKAFDGNSMDNFAKYLVGQALDGVRSIGAVHQVIHSFYDEWRKKFGK